MGYIIRAYCRACGYQSEELITGDGLNSVFICSTCSSVVNSRHIAFQYAVPRCCHCKNVLSELGWIDVKNMIVSYDVPCETEYPCPRCHSSTLGFQTIRHFSLSELLANLTPKVGTVVHAHYTDSGALDVVQLSGEYNKLHLEYVPDRAPNRLMELRVTRVIEEPLQKDQPFPTLCVTFEFVRYLTDGELEQAPEEGDES